MSLYKNGIWTENNIHEFNAVENYNNSEATYTPTKDATNSCCNLTSVDLSQFIGTTSDITLRIEIDIDYNNFDSSSTAGTFKMWWQGSNYVIAEDAYKWSGSNYIAIALQNEENPTTIVNEVSSGTYHYNTKITIPKTWWDSYSKSNIDLRTDYSNGVGTITMKNLKIYLDSEYGNGYAKINSNQNLVAQDFIEI